MRALVTGSTGLLGNNLVRTLLDAGHEVWALARSKSATQSFRCHFWCRRRRPSQMGGAITF